jgi:hypothetical protein
MAILQFLVYTWSIYFICKNYKFLHIMLISSNICKVKNNYKTMAKLTPKYIASNLSIVLGLVLIWRGIWYLLDYLDTWLFDGSHFWTAGIGVVVGLLVLYLPDKDLKEISKL